MQNLYKILIKKNNKKIKQIYNIKFNTNIIENKNNFYESSKTNN